MSRTVPFAPLFTGHDAGAYTLPADLLAARDTFVKVSAVPFPAPPRNAWETIHAVARATVDAVHNGTPLPDPARIEAARQAERVYQDVVDMMDLCREDAADRVRTAVDPDEVITCHLAPAHDETWETFKAAWRILTDYGHTQPRHLLVAPAKVRKAADTVEAASARYVLVRAARSVLHVQCPDDPGGKYAGIRNFHTLHPIRLRHGRTPWHGLDTRAFLGWMAEHGGDLWMPTAAQQAEAVEAEAHIGQPNRPT